ncbi:MAG: replication initiation protein [Mucispirillum schaedleri]|nr:replication initiation protein [Mucispirillum schaedleri]
MDTNIIDKINEKKKDIVLANDLIEAKYKLSALEQKVIHLLLAQIDLSDSDLKYYSLSVTDFFKIFNNNNYVRDIKRVLDGLLLTKIEIKSDNAVLKTTWFASAQYFEGGKIEIEFSRKLKPYLLGLKKSFTKYNLDYIIEFKSSYSIRIYQLLKQYQKIGMREIEVLMLKEYLQIENQYAKYSHFKEKVINVAYNEINKNTDISFTFEEIKKGRKVDKIKFYITANKKKSEDKSSSKSKKIKKEEKKQEAELDMDDLIDQLREIIKEPLKTKEYKSILQAADNNIKLIEQKYQIAQKQKKIDNLVGWLIAAIQEEYTEPVEKKKISQFNNIESRKYNYSELEKQLLG